MTRKATFRVAFRFVPVALAFLLSIFSITFLFNIQEASATSSESTTQPRSSSISPEYVESSSRTKFSIISPVFTKEVMHWEQEIVSWAENHGLDPNLVAVVMQIESCGHPSIRSQSGANGLFQVMPFHFSPEENPIHPDTNAKRGLRYLARSLELANANAALALAGYNGGHSVIMLDPASWAAETQRYVYWGSGILSDITKGKSHSPRLSEWLNAGGENLCNRAAEELGF